MPKLILIVEPNIVYALKLAKAAQDAGWMTLVQGAFAAARRDLETRSFDALAGNVRLDGFNAIHLAYLAKERRSDLAVILYSARHDPVIVREARAAGAFYEPMESLVPSLRAYLAASLPPSDRREASADPRRAFKGGRRASDRMKPALVHRRRDAPTS
jgi:DNA-binding NtrC family response regulator